MMRDIFSKNLTTTCTFVLVSFVLAGCLPTYVSPPAPVIPTDPAAIAAATKINHDDFQKITTYRGVNADSYVPLFLRAYRQDVDQTTKYQIYSQIFYSGDWQFYSTAFDANGKKMDLTKIASKVESCSGGTCYHSEDFALNVTRAYLEENRETGIKFKVSGKIEGGDRVKFIPPGIIKGFLEATK